MKPVAVKSERAVAREAAEHKAAVIAEAEREEAFVAGQCPLCFPFRFGLVWFGFDLSCLVGLCEVSGA